jgi:hypothetical protein
MPHKSRALSFHKLCQDLGGEGNGRDVRRYTPLWRRVSGWVGGTVQVGVVNVCGARELRGREQTCMPEWAESCGGED